MEGAFQTINQEFAAWLTRQGFSFVNREEDTGLPNLRKAKMSYHPCRLVRKYTACISEVVSAATADKDAMANLWAEVFHDTDAYIRLFLEKRFSPESLLLIREGGKLASMCAFLQAEFRTETGESVPIRYVYALATAPDHRGHGLARKLLDFADLFEDRVVRQGLYEDRSIERTLDIAWEILAELDIDQLTRIKKSLIQTYLPKKE